MSEIKYSIVIPHKNSPRLLQRLLATIPQSYGFQTIVVDDNSKNEDVEMLELLKKNYSFELYSNEGRYAGGARNTGMKYAKGKWLLFADADDYYTPDFERLLNEYYDSDADIIYFNTTSVNTDIKENASRHIPFSSVVENYCKNPSPRTADDLRYKFFTPWSKMVRRSMVVKKYLTFDEIAGANDMYFSMTSGFHANKIDACNEVMYVVTVTKGSISYILSFEQFTAKLYGAQHCNDFLRSIGKRKYQRSVLYFIARAHQFGVKGILHVWKEVIKHRSNVFIGVGRIFTIKSALKERENNKAVVKG